MASGKFAEPKHEIFAIQEEVSEEQASSAIHGIFQRMASGSFKKKAILKVEGSDE